MTVQQMRAELAKKYSQEFADKLSDLQVIATYKRLKSQDKI